MDGEEKILQEQSGIKLEDFTIFASYEILEDGTIIFSAED